MADGVYRVRPPRPLPRRFLGTARRSDLPRRPYPAAALRRDHQRRAHRPVYRRWYAGPRPTGVALPPVQRRVLRRPTLLRREQARQPRRHPWIGSATGVVAPASLVASRRVLRRPTLLRREQQRQPRRHPWMGARPVRPSVVIARWPTTNRHLQLPHRSAKVPQRRKKFVGSLPVLV